METQAVVSAASSGQSGRSRNVPDGGDRCRQALRIAHGAFGRVALLDMDRSLVRHAHPHCHVLLKVEGADTQFHGRRPDLSADRSRRAVLVNGWQPHAYVHDARPAAHPDPGALYRARMAEGVPAGLGRERRARASSSHPSGEVSPRIRSLAMDLAADMMARPGCAAAHEADAVRADDRGDRALHALAQLSGLDPGDERGERRLAHPPRADRCDAAPARSRADVDQFAKEAGLSRAHFFRLFESSLGVPPKVYLNVVRMERAVDAVLNQSAIALRDQRRSSALPEPAHFTRFFRNHAGVSPREFRNVSRLAS